MVNGKDYTPIHYVYVAGTGTPEAPKITPVSGNSGEPSCRFAITAAYAHPTGYTVASASGGIKEASEVARTNTAYSYLNGGKIVVDSAGSPYKIYAPLFLQASWQTIDGAGGSLQCYVQNDDCVIVGNRTSQTLTQNVTINDLIVNAANRNTTNFAWDAIHINAQSTTLHNSPKVGYSGPASATPGSFNSYISVCDDEAFTVDGLDIINGQGMRSDRRSQAIFALPEGHTRNTNNCYAVGWLKHINGNLQCHGNVITWLSGNGLRVSDSVIQGFSQYGILTGSPTGGYNGNTQLDNDYFEVGGCVGGSGNPDYEAAGATGTATGAQAGVLTQGGTVTAHGSTGITGAMPTFPCSGSGGNTQFNYWLVANQSRAKQGNGASAPLYFGNTPSGCSGTLTGYFPAIIPASGGLITYTIVRTTGTGGNIVIPYAGGCQGGSVSACGSVIVRKVPGGSTIESFADDVNVATTSYSLPGIAFVPYLPLWPGNLVLSAASPSNRTQIPVAALLGDQNLAGGNGIGIVSVNGNYGPSVFSMRSPGGSGGNASLGGISVHFGGYNTATLLMRNQQAYTDAANVKGRLNFIGTNLAGFYNGSIITLVDSNPDKTVATSNYRPTMDATDVWIGNDNSTYRNALNIPLAFGSPVSVSNYIGSLPDGSSFKERLTATMKTFKVPVTVNGNLNIAGGALSLPIRSTGYQCLHVNRDGVVSGTGADCGSAAGTGQRDIYTTTSGAKTIDGNLSVSGTITSSGTGPWSVTGAFGALTPPAPGKSMVGFDASGQLAVSENGGPVTEVQKKVPQQFTYTFFDANNQLTTALQVRSIYVNLVGPFHITSVYCEIDAGTATINLQSGGSDILSSDLACTTAGAISTLFVSGKDAVATGQKIAHHTGTASGLHRMNVVMTYTTD
jgi:hypothetical protein